MISALGGACECVYVCARVQAWLLQHARPQAGEVRCREKEACIRSRCGWTRQVVTARRAAHRCWVSTSVVVVPTAALPSQSVWGWQLRSCSTSPRWARPRPPPCSAARRISLTRAGNGTETAEINEKKTTQRQTQAGFVRLLFVSWTSDRNKTRVTVWPLL